MARGGWNPSLHPRDSDGKFKRKTRVSVRANLNSLSVQAGRTFRVSPKYQVYAGALLRVERTAPNKLQAMLEKMTNQALLKIAESIPNQRISQTATEIIERRGRADIGGVKIAASSGRSRSPAVRASIGSAKRTTAGQRAPRRKPRTRSNPALKGTKQR